MRETSIKAEYSNFRGPADGGGIERRGALMQTMNAIARCVCLPLLIIFRLRGTGPSARKAETQSVILSDENRGLSTNPSPRQMAALYNLGHSSELWNTQLSHGLHSHHEEAAQVGGKKFEDAYDAIVFFTDGDLDMDASQGGPAFLRSRRWQGFIGIHSAAITFTGWPEWEMLGGYFDGHPWGQFNARSWWKTRSFRHEISVDVLAVRRGDQIKGFSRQNVRVLMSLDAGKLDLTRKGVKRTDNDFAVIWAKNFGKGRVLYNGLGHVPALWERPDCQKMWLEMIQWSMGLVPGDATPRAKPNK
jgi:hypothetical protein